MRYAIQSARKGSKALGQSVGRIVQRISVMMVLSASSPNLTAEEQDRSRNVKMVIVRNGAYSGILSVKKVSTT